MTTIVNEVVPVFASLSDTVTVTGYVPGDADTEPVTVHVRVPGSVDAPDVAVTASASPAGSPDAVAVRPEPTVSASLAETVTGGEIEPPYATLADPPPSEFVTTGTASTVKSTNMPPASWVGDGAVEPVGAGGQVDRRRDRAGLRPGRDLRRRSEGVARVARPTWSPGSF